MKINLTSLRKKLAVGAAAVFGAGAASAAPNVAAVTADIDGAAAPIAAVAGASLSIYVGLRVWKMVRRAI